MKRIRVFYLILLAFVLTKCKTVEKNNIDIKSANMTIKKPIPPVAKKAGHVMTIHGDARTDNYYWMKLSDDQKNAEQPDAQTQEVLDYLHAENSYTTDMTKHLDGFRTKLFEEIVGRIEQTDMSVPYVMNGYSYATKFTEGKEYPIYSRTAVKNGASEEIMLDVNVLAEGFDYYSARGLSVSPNNKILSYGVDTLSRLGLMIIKQSIIQERMPR